MNFKLIIAMVKTTETDQIVDAAKASGGTGATIIPARGTGIHEAKTFFGLTLEAQTDVVLFLLEEKLVEPVLKRHLRGRTVQRTGHGHRVCAGRGTCRRTGKPDRTLQGKSGKVLISASGYFHSSNVPLIF